MQVLWDEDPFEVEMEFEVDEGEKNRLKQLKKKVNDAKEKVFDVK